MDRNNFLNRHCLAIALNSMLHLICWFYPTEASCEHLMSGYRAHRIKNWLYG